MIVVVVHTIKETDDDEGKMKVKVKTPQKMGKKKVNSRRADEFDAEQKG